MSSVKKSKKYKESRFLWSNGCIIKDRNSFKEHPFGVELIKISVDIVPHKSAIYNLYV